jgi:hypothetical protein
MFSTTNGAEGTISPGALFPGKELPNRLRETRNQQNYQHNSAISRSTIQYSHQFDDDFIKIAVITFTDLESWTGAKINPATTITPATSPTSPRHVKRSQSPDTYADLPTNDSLEDDGTSSFGSSIAIPLHSNALVATVAKLHTHAAHGRTNADDDISF